MPLAQAEQVLGLYREKYFDLNVRHFHKKLDAEHGIHLSHTWVKLPLQARGRSERNFGTWQGRLPQELRRHGISTLAEANRFLREHYVAEFIRCFQVPAAQHGTAGTACPRRDLALIFPLQCGFGEFLLNTSLRVLTCRYT